jgi:hypothetical protein
MLNQTPISFSQVRRLLTLDDRMHGNGIEDTNWESKDGHFRGRVPKHPASKDMVAFDS